MAVSYALFRGIDKEPGDVYEVSKNLDREVDPWESTQLSRWMRVVID